LEPNLMDHPMVAIAEEHQVAHVGVALVTSGSQA
jgi:hypothetical protein